MYKQVVSVWAVNDQTMEQREFRLVVSCNSFDQATDLEEQAYRPVWPNLDRIIKTLKGPEWCLATRVRCPEALCDAEDDERVHVDLTMSVLDKKLLK